MSLAAHKRWTVAFDTPAMRAIVRQLHRPSVAGGVTALSRTMRTASRGTEGLRPRPVASSNPARRLARNRWHQRLTVTRDTPTRAAIWCCEIPAALRTTISARCRSRTATVDALIRRSNSPLSWPLSTILLRATASPNGRPAACPKHHTLSSYFRDTTLVYALDTAAPQHAAARTLVETARAETATLYVTSQILCEFYSVMTNPRRVARPRTADEAMVVLSDMLTFLHVL